LQGARVVLRVGSGLHVIVPLFARQLWLERPNTRNRCIQLLIAYISIFSDENPYSLLNAWRPAYIIAKPLLIWPGIGLVRLHYAFAPPARLYISRAKKSLYRLRKPANFAILELTQYKSADRRFCMPGSKLMDVLFIEHLLLNVVDNMHYQDVVNLSMTCHAAREAVYPRNDLAMRVPKLEGICCEKDTKRTCLYCNKIMCSVSATVLLPSAVGHINEHRLNVTNTVLHSNHASSSTARPPTYHQVQGLLPQLLLHSLQPASERVETALQRARRQIPRRASGCVQELCKQLFGGHEGAKEAPVSAIGQRHCFWSNTRA